MGLGVGGAKKEQKARMKTLVPSYRIQRGEEISGSQVLTLKYLWNRYLILLIKTVLSKVN